MAKNETENRVLVIGDLHLPYVKAAYFDFCRDLKRRHRCNRVVFIGDVVDLHAISFHEKHPEADGAMVEIAKARKAVHKWHKAFPNATVVIGNHDRRCVRRAASVSVPEIALKTFNEIWDTPNWEWATETVIDGVRYIHGDGAGGGLFAAYNVMRKTAMSHVLGHNHTCSGVKYLCNPERRLFGMDVGCGCDWKAIQFLYQERNPVKPVISAGVVLDGTPQLYVMPMGKGEKYSDKG